MNAAAQAAVFAAHAARRPVRFEESIYDDEDLFSDSYSDSDYSEYSDYDDEYSASSSLFQKIVVPRAPSVAGSMASSVSSVSATHTVSAAGASRASQTRSLLSVALQRSALRRAKPSQFRNLSGLEDQQTHQQMQESPARPQSPMLSCVQMELTDSLRQNLLWDRAMPFNTVISRHAPAHGSSFAPDAFGHNYW
ncbi:hypothetical protein BC831DRAFT_446721 [Entophlyctis helioformis]|nr:hypothetical protein BC831DRAFT_446721 [Entophlyctis helioformis]